MEYVKVDEWMLRDFTELVREHLKEEAKKYTFHKYSDFIEWVDMEIKEINSTNTPIE